MRLRWGPVPDDPDFTAEHEGWIRLKEPTFGWMLVAALPLSVFLVLMISLAWATVARVRGIGGESTVVATPSTALILVLAVGALILAHELAHAAVLPSCGLTAATTLGFWPKTATPYVGYVGELSRNRQIAVGTAPFLILSVAPVIVGLCFSVAPLWLVALSAVNAFGASGDLLGAGLIAFQVPASGVVRNKGLDTWWRVPAQQ
jgi:hypothetical protein